MEEENQSVPSAEASAQEPMSFDSALDMLNAADNTPAETPAAPEPAEAEPEGVEAEQAEPSTDEAEATPDADPETELVLHGNAKTRLRDGREVTISELKKRWDEAEEYKAKQAEFDTRAREIEQKQQAIAAQENLFTNSIQQAQAILRANFPPKPDEALLEQGDTFTYMEQKARYDAAVAKWQGLERARVHHVQQAEHKRTETERQYLASEMERLKDRAPEFKSDDYAKSFRQEVLKAATEQYGASQEQVLGIKDAWLVLAMKDAIAYRKLQAEKPKAMEKAKDAPPVQVQPPGRRASPQEQRATVVKSGFDRLRKTGSFDDALAILNTME